MRRASVPSVAETGGTGRGVRGCGSLTGESFQAERAAGERVRSGGSGSGRRSGKAGLLAFGRPVVGSADASRPPGAPGPSRNHGFGELVRVVVVDATPALTGGPALRTAAATVTAYRHCTTPDKGKALS
ncbi:hypothetical protein GCM10010430_26980 [Kitasatospora cystarginea]|uniref:Uncharacterized protein n=1 Tax=Kitasatospora cystarginea TaxID=58350 RepID=A0ABN3DXK2_9ACTN